MQRCGGAPDNHIRTGAFVSSARRDFERLSARPASGADAAAGDSKLGMFSYGALTSSTVNSESLSVSVSTSMSSREDIRLGIWRLKTSGRPKQSNINASQARRARKGGEPTRASTWSAQEARGNA